MITDRDLEIVEAQRAAAEDSVQALIDQALGTGSAQVSIPARGTDDDLLASRFVRDAVPCLIGEVRTLRAEHEALRYQYEGTRARLDQVREFATQRQRRYLSHTTTGQCITALLEVLDGDRVLRVLEGSDDEA